MELCIRVAAEVITFHPQLGTVVPILLEKRRGCLNSFNSFFNRNLVVQIKTPLKSHLISK